VPYLSLAQIVFLDLMACTGRRGRAVSDINEKTDLDIDGEPVK
jgi:hypothetical protein